MCIRDSMGLVPDPPGKVTSGEILLNGENLLQKSAKDMRLSLIHIWCAAQWFSHQRL